MKFKFNDTIYNVLDEQAEKYGGCHMTWMNREVMDKHDAHPFAWFKSGKTDEYDYYAQSGNFWD